MVGLAMATTALLAGCADDEKFSTSRGDVLSFPLDTLWMDTVFSNVPTPTQSFWVYNRSAASLRCSAVRLLKGAQSGYRVNVDGAYLAESAGFQVQDVEIRKGDSIRVFVELTSPVQHSDEPQAVSDDLVFQLESGVEQKVNLKAWSWDALVLNDWEVSSDTCLQSAKPVVVRGVISVDKDAALTIAAGTRLFFHEDAGMMVYGSLRVEGERGKEVVMRGDRLDHMFSYLPYDRTPGRWQGIRLLASSHDNVIQYADIHSAYDAIVATGDSTDARPKLTMLNATVHNSQGYGVNVSWSKVRLENCLLSNALANCLYVKGGTAELNGCTIAQFYPFDASRGTAFVAENRATKLSVKNSLVTGYHDCEMEVRDGSAVDTLSCVVRREGASSDMGAQHFRQIDTDNFIYDFHLSEKSTAIGAADAATSLKVDRDGAPRSATPSAGCYSFMLASTKEKGSRSLMLWKQ